MGIIIWPVYLYVRACVLYGPLNVRAEGSVRSGGRDAPREARSSAVGGEDSIINKTKEEGNEKNKKEEKMYNRKGVNGEREREDVSLGNNMKEKRETRERIK